jgi:ribosome-associated toxin RatA of RatAB toxin-antitoxin module
VIRKENFHLQLDAPQEAVFALLADYGSYREWVPDITHSRVLVQEGEITIAEFEAPRYGAGKFAFELVHTPPVSVIYSQIGRYGGHGISGGWDLEEVEGGNKVVLRGRVHARTFFYDLTCRKTMRRALAHIVANVKKRAETGKVRKKILAVTERPQSLRVWLRGEEFELPRKSTSKK